MSAITRRTALLGLTATLALPLLGCAGPSPARTMTMASGDAGGSYVRFAELLREAMRRRGAPELGVVVTNGSVENLDLLGEGAVDLAIALADTVETNSGDAVAIGRVYQNYLQCITRADGDVRALADLAGRRVSAGAAGSGTALTARRLLAATGLGVDDPRGTAPLLSEHPLGEALDALADGAIDALFWSGGIPTPQVDELSATTRLRLVDLAVAVPALDAAHPGAYLVTSVPAGVYSTTAATPTIGIPNYLLARPDLDDAFARTLVDVLIDDAHRLVAEETVGVQYLTPATLIDTGTVPLHPAAKQEYAALYG